MDSFAIVVIIIIIFMITSLFGFGLMGGDVGSLLDLPVSLIGNAIAFPDRLSKEVKLGKKIDKLKLGKKIKKIKL